MPSLSHARAVLESVGVVTDDDLLAYALSMLLGAEDEGVAEEDVIGLLPEVGELSSAARGEVLQGLRSAAQESDDERVEQPRTAAPVAPPFPPPVFTRATSQEEEAGEDDAASLVEEELWEVWEEHPEGAKGKEEEGEEEEEEEEGEDALLLLNAVLLLQEGPSGLAFTPDAIFAACSLAAERGLIEGQAALLLLEEAQRRCLAARPCRHAMQGGCLLHGCGFDHDLGGLPCRFWLLPGDGCLLPGQNGCPFAHGRQALLPLVEALLESSPQRGPSPSPSRSQSDFPKLPGGGETVAKARRGDAGLFGFRGGMGFRQALVTAPPPAPAGAAAGLSSHGRADGFPRSSHNSNSSSSRGSEGFGAESWVEGGRCVSRDYAAVRQEARTLALARNRLLEEATRAFVAGDGAAARSASIRGRELNAAMHEAHAAAALLIFHQRNPAPGSSTVDLHGLHVAEALALLDGGLLDRCRKHPGRPSVRLVTGSGHHSHQESRLLPAVKTWLRSNGFAFVDVRDAGGHTGGVAVDL